MNTFTVEKALKYQKAQLAQWKPLLRDEVFQQLEEKIAENNATLTPESTGYDVARGDDLLVMIFEMMENDYMKTLE